MPSYTIHMLTKEVGLNKEFNHLKEITANNHKVISSIPADLNLLAADIAGTRKLIINLLDTEIEQQVEGEQGTCDQGNQNTPGSWPGDSISTSWLDSYDRPVGGPGVAKPQAKLTRTTRPFLLHWHRQQRAGRGSRKLRTLAAMPDLPAIRAGGKANQRKQNAGSTAYHA